jgi:hypothetical protein
MLARVLSTSSAVFWGSVTALLALVRAAGPRPFPLIRAQGWMGTGRHLLRTWPCCAHTLQHLKRQRERGAGAPKNLPREVEGWTAPRVAARSSASWCDRDPHPLPLPKKGVGVLRGAARVWSLCDRPPAPPSHPLPHVWGRGQGMGVMGARWLLEKPTPERRGDEGNYGLLNPKGRGEGRCRNRPPIHGRAGWAIDDRCGVDRPAATST